MFSLFSQCIAATAVAHVHRCISVCGGRKCCCHCSICPFRAQKKKDTIRHSSYNRKLHANDANDTIIASAHPSMCTRKCAASNHAGFALFAAHLVDWSLFSRSLPLSHILENPAHIHTKDLFSEIKLYENAYLLLGYSCSAVLYHTH